MRGKQIAKEVVLWALTILMVLTFGNAGIRKFFDHGGWTVMFHNLGLPDWFRITIGVIEAGAALLLLHPRTASYGALMNMTVMVGAITTMVMHGWTRAFAPPIVALVINSIIFAARWRQRVTLGRAGSPAVAT